MSDPSPFDKSLHFESKEVGKFCKINVSFEFDQWEKANLLNVYEFRLRLVPW